MNNIPCMCQIVRYYVETIRKRIAKREPQSVQVLLMDRAPYRDGIFKVFTYLCVCVWR